MEKFCFLPLQSGLLLFSFLLSALWYLTIPVTAFTGQTSRRFCCSVELSDVTKRYFTEVLWIVILYSAFNQLALIAVNYLAQYHQNHTRADLKLAIAWFIMDSICLSVQVVCLLVRSRSYFL